MKQSLINFALTVAYVGFGFWLRGFCKHKPKALTMVLTKRRREPIPKEAP